MIDQRGSQSHYHYQYGPFSTDTNSFECTKTLEITIVDLCLITIPLITTHCKKLLCIIIVWIFFAAHVQYHIYILLFCTSYQTMCAWIYNKSQIKLLLADDWMHGHYLPLIMWCSFPLLDDPRPSITPIELRVTLDYMIRCNRFADQVIAVHISDKLFLPKACWITVNLAASNEFICQ